MSQLLAGETFTDVTPGKTVTSTRLNNHVAGAVLLNGAVIDQAERTTPNAADTLLLGDSTNPNTSVPQKIQIGNLLLQSQRDGSQRWGGVAGGTANAIAITTSPASTGAYVAGETVRFKTAGAANSGAVTLNIDTRGAVNLFNADGVALASGDLPANAYVQATYDGTQFITTRVVIATKTITSYMAAEKLRGDCQQYITAGGTANAISLTLLDSSGAATFSALYDGMLVRFKAAATNTAAVTLAVNGQGTPALVGPGGNALNAGAIQSGMMVMAVYDLANTRFVVCSPLKGWDYVSTAAATLAAGITDFTHGLGAAPTKVRVVLLCTTAQSVWAVNDELDACNVAQDVGNVKINWWVDATNGKVRVALASTTNLYAITASGTSTSLTAANFKFKVYASL